MDETLKERAENYIRRFTSLHNQVKTALTTKANSTAMELLEQCQKTAQELADMIETETPKALQVIPILEDYCELVYLVNEEIWHGERVNPGKVYRYMNKCLTMMGESLGLKPGIETAD